MTIFNSISGGSAGRSGKRSQPILYNFSVSSVNTSSITVRLNISAGLFAGGSYRLVPDIAQTVTGFNSLGCHATLKNSGIPYAVSAVAGGGTSFPTQLTLTNLYYDSEYDLTLSLTTAAGTDYYTIRASTLSPSEIILIGNSNVSGAVTNFTNSNFPLIAPRGVTSGAVLCIGAGGGASVYGGGGGGGGLAYGNAIPLNPGIPIAYQIGGTSTGVAGAGGNTWFSSTAYLFAGGGAVGTTGNGSTGGGGGGAAGYAGNGGAGGAVTTPNYAGGAGGSSSGTARTGGATGGAGGGGGSTAVIVNAAGAASGGSGAGGSGGWTNAQGGGGVLIYGQSSLDINGITTTAGTATAASGAGAYTNNGGSGGWDGSTGTGGNYGGGAGGAAGIGAGGVGVMRVVFDKGIVPSFPSTRVSATANPFTYQF